MDDDDTRKSKKLPEIQVITDSIGLPKERIHIKIEESLEVPHNPKGNAKPEHPTVPLIIPSIIALPETASILGTFTQLLTAVAVSLLSLSIGYATAYTSPSDASLRRDLHIGNSEMAFIGGLMPLSAVFGGLIGGASIEYCGRKGTMFITNVIFLVSWIIIYVSRNVYYLYVGRCLAGLSVGLATLTLPVYLVETVQPEVRGILGLLPMTLGNTGILLCFGYGIFVDWKHLAIIGLLLTLPFFTFFLWIIPETPTWYILHNKPDKCKKSLAWLRGDKQDITEEFNELVTKHGEKSRESLIKNLFTPSNRRPLTIVLGLMVFQQFSGINAIIFYTTSIFRASGSHLPPRVCTTIIGMVNLISTLIANGLIDKLGRKFLLQMSSVVMTIGLGSIGMYYYIKEVMENDVTECAFLPLASLMIFVFGFSIGFGPIPWLMMGELLPTEARSLAASVATALNWTCTFIITSTFPSVAETFGYFTIFWFYCCMVIMAGVLTCLFVPETKGRSLADIERMSGQNIRRVRYIAHLKPLPSTNM